MSTIGPHTLVAQHGNRYAQLQALPRKPAPTLYAGGRTFASKALAHHYAERSGMPETGATAYQRADGSWVGVVLLRPDHFWLYEHVTYLGCVAYPAEYPLPAFPGQIPQKSAA